MYYKRMGIANSLFLISAGLIYLLNVLMHLFLWRISLDDILVNIVLPLASTVAMMSNNLLLNVVYFLCYGLILQVKQVNMEEDEEEISLD